MDKEYLAGLLKYNFSVNRKIFAETIKPETAAENGLKYFSHLLAAEKIWILRLQNKEWIDVEVWPLHSKEEIYSMMNENEKEYIKYLSAITKEELALYITYKNIKGVEYKNSVEDILIHVVLHGSYHRAQFASALRAESLEPVNTDYIAYKREMKIQ